MSTVPLTENLLSMQIGIQHIMERHEQMHVLVSVVMVNLKKHVDEHDECYTEYRLIQTLESMLSDMASHNDIEKRLNELLSGIRPPQKVA